MEFQPALISFYRNRSLLFSATRYAQLELFMNRPISVKNGTVYLQKTMEECKAVNIPSEARAHASPQGMIEQNGLNQFALFVFSPGQEGKTVTRKRIGYMALLCIIYDIHLRKLQKGFSFGAKCI